MAKKDKESQRPEDKTAEDYNKRPVVLRRGEIETTDFKFNVGDEVRDLVTGLEGIVTGREDCITGCSRMSVQPKVTDGKTMPSGYFIDQDRLELLVEAHAPMFEVVKAGGPMTPTTLDRSH